ncbi:hypothetical protein [Chryseolinea soli]|uniref:Uncharacterized protein n=1 Tax=Chryseolinea soli TaxID=2321403 RepID=A0A385SU92_9BACT|nr:hypothetical protein [Chryseolinea soli]AYB33545.1 hypothetical protein D4L85_24460 [Chryseolinea soli]
MATYDSTIYINQTLGLTAGELLDKLELNKAWSSHDRLKIGPPNITLANAILKEEVAVGEWNNCTIISSNALSNIWIGAVPLRSKLLDLFPGAQMLFIFHESVANATFIVWVDQGEVQRKKVTQLGHIAQYQGDLLDFGAPLKEEYEYYQVSPGEDAALRKNKDYKSGQHDYNIALELLRKYVLKADVPNREELVLNKNIDTYFTDDDLLDRNFQIDRKESDKAVYDVTYQKVKPSGFKKESRKTNVGSDKIFSKELEDGILIVRSGFALNAFSSSLTFESQQFTEVWLKVNQYDKSPVRGPALVRMYIAKVNTKRAYGQALSDIENRWDLLAPKLPALRNIRNIEEFYQREGLLESRFQVFLTKDTTNHIAVNSFQSFLTDRIILSYCSGSSGHAETVRQCREMFQVSVNPASPSSHDQQTFLRAAALKVGL